MSKANVDYRTWNPVLNLDVVSGPFSAEELRERTLRFEIRDFARRYDEIEWTLDNRDGLMTRPEFLALGLLLRVRYGY
jgi:hypothetical protein